MTGRETAGPSRRRLLRTVGNLGVGAGLVWGGGADYAASSAAVEITYALARPPGGGDGLEPRTRTVPADWHRSVRAAFDVRGTLRGAELSPRLGAFVVPGSFDEPVATIAVDAGGTAAEEGVSALVADASVEVAFYEDLFPKPRRPSLPDDPFHLAATEGGTVPGGGFCTTPKMGGTLAPAAFDAESGDRFFLTSNHLYGEQGTKVTAHRDEPLSLRVDGGTRTIGRVVRGYPNADFVRATPADRYHPIPELARAVPATVAGQFTRMGLAARMARGEPLRKYGAVSGHTVGRIYGVDGFSCHPAQVCRTGQLIWGDKLSMTDGDSGSVNYAPDPERPEEAVLVGGLNNARSWWPRANFTWGTAAHHLLDRYGLHF